MSIDKFGRSALSAHHDRYHSVERFIVSFPKTPNGNYDIENRRLSNVADGADPSDCVTKKQLDDLSKSVKTELETFKNDVLAKIVNIDALQSTTATTVANTSTLSVDEETNNEEKDNTTETT